MHYHIVGIAGMGMSAIAHILVDQGHTVSGCDQQRNALTNELAQRGVAISQGHDAMHLDDVDVVAISSALKPDHPELVAARKRGIPVEKRADLWRAWSQAKSTLAIAGTHGKTTTTAMCALTLETLGYDPAYVVPAGGPVPGLPRFAKWGSGPFVIEADEYDRVFLGLLPQVSIITSVDWDHVDIYPTRASVEEAFVQFASQTKGVTVVCADDAGARKLHVEYAVSLSYGLASNADWWAGNIEMVDGSTQFMVQHARTGQRFAASLQVPGRHNVQNALGAAVGVYELLGHDVAMDHILAALSRYQGAARRFELKGEADSVTVIDDYAHNPPKVRAALDAARTRYPDHRLVVYFQPHTFSRTQALIDDFATAFGAADVVLVGDIYPSRERQADFPLVTARWLAEHIQAQDVHAVGDLDGAVATLHTLLQPGDILLTLGAGDGNKVGERILSERAATQAEVGA